MTWMVYMRERTYMYTAEFVIYDDACHLKKYACNPVRCNKTPTAQKLASLSTVVDRFHLAGHVDPWCQENCNPLKKVSVHSLIQK